MGWGLGVVTGHKILDRYNQLDSCTEYKVEDLYTKNVG